MKKFLSLICVAVTSLLFATSAFAQATAPTCSAAAQEKKLAGAAKTSFLKKCEREATEKCEAVATERKLAGAAKNSNVKKCVREALGI
jgi:hypothetical protein